MLARKGKQQLVTAPGAAHASETSRDVSAVQIAAQLLFDIEGIPLAVVAALDPLGEEGQQVVADHPVKDALVRLARLFARRERTRRGTLEALVDRRLAVDLHADARMPLPCRFRCECF